MQFANFDHPSRIPVFNSICDDLLQYGTEGHERLALQEDALGQLIPATEEEGLISAIWRKIQDFFQEDQTTRTSRSVYSFFEQNKNLVKTEKQETLLLMLATLPKDPEISKKFNALVKERMQVRLAGEYERKGQRSLENVQNWGASTKKPFEKAIKDRETQLIGLQDNFERKKLYGENQGEFELTQTRKAITAAVEPLQKQRDELNARIAAARWDNSHSHDLRLVCAQGQRIIVSSSELENIPFFKERKNWTEVSDERFPHLKHQVDLSKYELADVMTLLKIKRGTEQVAWLDDVRRIEKLKQIADDLGLAHISAQLLQRANKFKQEAAETAEQQRLLRERNRIEPLTSSFNPQTGILQVHFRMPRAQFTQRADGYQNFGVANPETGTTIYIDDLTERVRITIAPPWEAWKFDSTASVMINGQSLEAWRQSHQGRSDLFISEASRSLEKSDVLNVTIQLNKNRG